MNIAELNERIILETGYRSQLAKKYKEMVNYEADEMMDYFDAAHFAAKAIKALDDDDPPGPEKLKNWHIKNPFKEDLTKAFKRLNVALNMGIRDSIPEATAEAVVGFDCWVEQTEEGWQLSHIRLCRDRFKNAMKQIEDKVGLTITDEATAERKIVIYYDHDSSTISPEDRAYLSAELMRIPMHEKISLVVTGHADRKGSERYNQNLSMERAIGIHRVLANFGIREQSIGISAEGETAPAILTKDGASEPQNRRSEILIKLQL
tara:strand:- start:2634 stop:3422 length:789 start_codon:yes stop_codon:yes gene_type:complete